MTPTATSNPPNSAVSLRGAVAVAAEPRRRWRIRWGRLLFIATLAYVGAGAVFSIARGLALYHEEQVLKARIAAVEAENRALRQDVSALRNPATLKAILQGKRPLPNVSAPTP